MDIIKTYPISKIIYDILNVNNFDDVKKLYHELYDRLEKVGLDKNKADDFINGEKRKIQNRINNDRGFLFISKSKSLKEVIKNIVLKSSIKEDGKLILYFQKDLTISEICFLYDMLETIYRKQKMYLLLREEELKHSNLNETNIDFIKIESDRIDINNGKKVLKIIEFYLSHIRIIIETIKKRFNNPEYFLGFVLHESELIKNEYSVLNQDFDLKEISFTQILDYINNMFDLESGKTIEDVILNRNNVPYNYFDGTRRK